jgi:hypothetical protein
MLHLAFFGYFFVKVLSTSLYKWPQSGITKQSFIDGAAGHYLWHRSVWVQAQSASVSEGANKIGPCK